MRNFAKQSSQRAKELKHENEKTEDEESSYVS